MELTIGQALQNAIEAHKAGQVQEADRLYTAILQAQPKHPDANHNMGVLAVGVGKVQEALPFFKTALEASPDTAQFWLSYIDALIKLDKLTDAKAFLDQAKSKGAQGDRFDQLEKMLSKQGTSKSQTTQDPPQHQLLTLRNLCGQGQYQEALRQSKNLMIEYPNSVKIYNLIGVSSQGLGKLEEAVEAFNKALKIKPDYAKANFNMGITLERITFKKPNRDLQKTIISMLEQKAFVRPVNIANATITLLKFEPNLQKHLQLVDDEVLQSPLDVISDLSELPLLMKLMNVCPLPDLKLEKLLKNLRNGILLNILDIKDASPELLRFQSALALQCYTNEYIYNHSEEEEKALLALEKIVKKAFKGNEQPSPQMILALASYKVLNQYDWCNLLVTTDLIQEVIIRQIEEPQKEKDLKPYFPVLEEITDNVSSEVSKQYEESPYPRWVNLGLDLKPKLISQMVDEIKLNLHDYKIFDVEKPEILIAGCGTGQHSIGTAARFKSAMVLAIDLSLSSLAYAKRKTEEFRIENIKYMQADILDSSHLNKQFDIIESVGVLHHMADPRVGWEALTDCLKPGGLMKIGLYSELARQHIMRIREEISQLGIGSSNKEMRSFRDLIIKSEKDHHKLIMNSGDFYSLSTLKDLLFHVQEHRFTIPLIKDHLDKLGLHFCGFESKVIASHFKLTNTYKEDPYDLNKWQAYEEANQRSFAGMYQFWCQKAA